MGSSTPREPRTETYSQGSVEVRIVVDPPVVHLDRDLLLTLTLTAPNELDLQMPDIGTRAQGFVIKGTFDQEPVTQDGKAIRVRRVRLTPLIAPEYRLAPMAVLCTDRGASPPQPGWFATRPMVFETAALVEGRPAETITSTIGPVWIAPDSRTFLLYVLAALPVAGLIFLLWKLTRRVRHEMQMRKLSPRERALRELDLLLAKRLVETNRVKDFYLELTLVVRRYIERAHFIRAPEQTTPEFLTAVSRNPRFSREVVERLKLFLEAADLVKFAAWHPEQGAIDNATRTARDYVEKDAGPSQEAAGPGAETPKHV